MGKILQSESNGHYLTVELEKDGIKDTVYVHDLVAAAFLGPCPKGMVVCHGPGGPLDNSAENLFYGPKPK